MMNRLKHLAPTLLMAALTAVLLLTRSMSIVKVVFFGAVLGLSFLAGESLARVLPKSVTLMLAICCTLGVGAAVAFGWVRFGSPVPVAFGNIALTAVAVGVPTRAYVVQKWPSRGIVGFLSNPE
jgi:hypothetical protein